jgi:hypothetical protein
MPNSGGRAESARGDEGCASSAALDGCPEVEAIG